MYRKIEDLVTELWLEIFDYLKLHDQFNAFFNLNKRFNQILFSYLTQISWKNNDEASQYLFKHILPHLTHRENVTNLRLENTNKIDLIAKADLLYFPHLTALTLHRLNITKDFLRIFQQNTTHLRYLNVSSLVSGDKKSIHQLFEMIISLLNLQICRLRLGISMSPIQLKISSKSPIKDLRLIGMNENCLTDRLAVFLQHLPCLQSLHIFANQVNFGATINTDNIYPTPISIFSLNINQFNGSFSQFTNFILTLTPYVQEFKIICRTPFDNLTYLNHREWIMLIKFLPNLKNLSLDIKRSNGINEQIWDKYCQKLTKFMTSNHIVLQIGK